MMDCIKSIFSLVLNTYMYKLKSNQCWINSLRLCDAYMRQYNIPTLVQIMACRLFSAKPLSEPLAILSIGSQRTYFSEISLKIQNFSFKEMHLKMSSVKWRPFWPGLNVLKSRGQFYCVFFNKRDSKTKGLGLWCAVCLSMMTSSNGNIFRVTGPLCGEFIGHRWIFRTKASDAELWCFIWSPPE